MAPVVTGGAASRRCEPTGACAARAGRAASRCRWPGALLRWTPARRPSGRLEGAALAGEWIRATLFGRTERVDERIDEHRDIAAAAQAGGPSPAGCRLRASGCDRLAATGRQKL